MEGTPISPTGSHIDEEDTGEVVRSGKPASASLESFGWVPNRPGLTPGLLLPEAALAFVVF